MNFDLRLKALAGLMHSRTEQAGTALTQALDRAQGTLREETQYQLIEQALSVLEVIGPRFSNQVVPEIVNFTTSVKTRPLTHAGELAEFVPLITKYRNASKLIARSVEVLSRLRYLETKEITAALLELSIDDDEDVRSKSLDALKQSASYDIEVFYGNDQQRGIGARPQKDVADFISDLNDEDFVKYQQAIVQVAEGLLSATIEGTKWSSSTITISRGAVPAIPDVAEVRSKAIDSLKRLYWLVREVPQKFSVISALQSATRPNMGGNSDEAVKDMIARNCVDVLRFFESLVADAEFPIVQKIESYSYWIFYHSSSPEVKSNALQVERTIGANLEYQIYKTLIGFEGIFGPWEQLRKEDGTWNEVDRFRKEKAEEFARNITLADYPSWRERIISYSKTESQDLATFPVFYYFLEVFAKTQPGLALKLVLEDSDRIASFLIPLLRGLWMGPEQTAIKEVVSKWIASGRNLYASAKQFLDCANIDVALLMCLLKKAGDLDDLNTVAMVMSVVVSNDQGDDEIVRDLFVPALEILTEHQSARWVFDIWYRREARALIERLDDGVIDLILDNLMFLEAVNYHAEEILYSIAKRNSKKVVEFFCRRSAEEKDYEKILERYDAVPFALQKLNKPLALQAEMVVGIVRKQYDKDSKLFMFRGAQLLKIIFSEFPPEFEGELLKIVNSDGDQNIEFVLAVLRNYEGETFIHNVCRAIIQRLPNDSSLWSEISIALQNTGGVSGEYGFVEAYERKKAEVQDWLNDPSDKTKAFATWYIAQLDQMILAERRRADEEIALRKQRYDE